jgi:CheY-like chemotaxis protein
VLVVDDQEAIREALADLLSDEGYGVLTAANGAEALDKLRQRPRPQPCLIFLDLMMPIMNGQEFYVEKQLDPELASIPVVVMSAAREVRQKTLFHESECLSKPVRVETILGAVARHCGGVPASPSVARLGVDGLAPATAPTVLGR